MKFTSTDISDYKKKFFEEGIRQAATEDFINFNILREMFPNIESDSYHELMDEFIKGFNSIEKG